MDIRRRLRTRRLALRGGGVIQKSLWLKKISSRSLVCLLQGRVHPRNAQLLLLGIADGGGGQTLVVDGWRGSPAVVYRLCVPVVCTGLCTSLGTVV